VDRGSGSEKLVLSGFSILYQSVRQLYQPYQVPFEGKYCGAGAASSFLPEAEAAEK
jgi:hypothetical protein